MLLNQAARSAATKSIVIDDRVFVPPPPMPTWRGAALIAQSITATEWIISGPSETGKTVAGLHRLDAFARANPNAKLAIVRKVRATMYSSVLAIFERLFVTGKSLGVVPFGGKKPDWYEYPNGARVYVAGMDDAGKVLGGELDAVYVNQAEQITVDDWQTLTTRTTGRAGNVKDPMTFGDCNPDAPGHWIKQRSDAGALTLLESVHVDNPSLYLDDGTLTDQGRRTMATLERLTGVRRLRLLKGLWVQAEGTVYEDQFVDAAPLIDDAAEYDPGRGDILIGADDGYSGEWTEDGFFTEGSHPRVFLFAQLDGTGALNVFDELYQIRTLTKDGIDQLREQSPLTRGLEGEAKKHKAPADTAAVDQSASELRRYLTDADVRVVGSPRSVDESIKTVRDWMAPDENGRRRIRIHSRCKLLRRELATYAIGANGKPVKAFDHGPDALRYLVWAHRR